jgi:SAM-dependent methyltransferase
MSEPPIDPGAFRDFERAAHSRNADTYHDLFTAVTDRAIAPLLDAARVGAGTRLLDVASGPGHLAAAAAARDARATGVDLAPGMVELARRLCPGVEFCEASAEVLPFDDGAFDAVTCAFGLGHFSEPGRVVAEFARVLAPRGVAALSWWDGFARNRINGIFHEAIAHLGVSAPGALPPGPPIDRFSDRDRLAKFLRSAGFDAARVETVSFTHRLKGADQLWDMAMGSYARASAMIRAQSEAVQREIKAAVTEAARQYASPGGLDIPVAFLIAAGTKP